MNTSTAIVAAVAAFCAAQSFAADDTATLRVNVDAGATNALKAADVAPGVASIVKTGAGALAVPSMPNYAGTFDIQGGAFQVSGACGTTGAVVNVRNGASLEFVSRDGAACRTPKVRFAASAGETQSITGGVYDERPTMAGIEKTGAGTLFIDSPVCVEGFVDIQAGTLKIANRANMNGSSVDEVIAPMPVLDKLSFGAGTTLDLSDSMGCQITDIVGSPSVTNSGVFGVIGKWTLTSPKEVLSVAGSNPHLASANMAGLLAFSDCAEFDFRDAAAEAAYSNAVVAAGSAGLVVARARWIMDDGSQMGDTLLAMPQPTSSTSKRWAMHVGDNHTTLRLALSTDGAKGK